MSQANRPTAPRNAAQLASPSYRLAALDADFLLGGSMRGARFMLEFEKADELLRAYGVASTIVVFGSARAREGGPPDQARWYAAARAFAALDSPEEVGRIAAERAVRKLGARKVPTQTVPVIWDPTVGRSLVGHLARAITGDALYRRATFLLDREGETVASPLVTLVDDATLHAGLRSRPFDGEGATARRNEVLTSGVFRGYLMDTYAARKTGRQTTGSASRGVASSQSGRIFP